MVPGTVRFPGTRCGMAPENVRFQVSGAVPGENLVPRRKPVLFEVYMSAYNVDLNVKSYVIYEFFSFEKKF